jgi:hypothetical protein
VDNQRLRRTGEADSLNDFGTAHIRSPRPTCARASLMAD